MASWNDCIFKIFFIQMNHRRTVKSRLERLNNSISSKSYVDVILIFFKDFVDLWLIEIPCWSIIDSHDFIIFMKFHPSSTTEWNIFHCWKVVSIFIHLESVLRQWSFCNSVCIGLKLNDFLLAGMSRFSPLDNSYLPLGLTFLSFSYFKLLLFQFLVQMIGVIGLI